MKKNLPINEVICGDSLSVLRTFPSKSVDMCMTSPPYWGLRDYGVEQIFGGDLRCEHEWEHLPQPPTKNATVGGTHENVGQKRSNKTPPSGSNCCLKCQAWKGQLGLEPTPELYVEHLTKIFSEVKRVLKKEGTLWLNIGDTYSTHTSKRSGQFGKEIKDGFDDIYSKKRILPLKEKCLCMIPERLAWSLIQDGWILRNKIIWYKPNAMPSSVTDRFSNRYEFIYMFSRQQKYYFDLDAVRKAHQYPIDVARRMRQDKAEGVQPFKKGDPICRHTKIPGQISESFGSPRARYNREGYEDLDTINPLGKNPGDVFEINTQPFPEAHFAVFPEKLCEKPIKAGCPEEVCKKCGKARERIVEKGLSLWQVNKDKPAKDYPTKKDNYKRSGPEYWKHKEKYPDKIIGWTSCSCNAGFEGGILLDPFCGAGTALYVAKEMKRRYVGIDIKQEFKEMSDKRLAQGVL